MPVPAGRFEGEMIVRCKVSASDAQEHHDQHDRSQRDMRTVKTGQQKKRSYNMPGDKGKQGRDDKWSKNKKARATLQKQWKFMQIVKMGMVKKQKNLTED